MGVPQMTHGKIAVLGIARTGFDTDLGLRLYQGAVSSLAAQKHDLLRPDSLFTDPEEAGRFAARCRSESVDALIALFTTFADGRFIARIAEEVDRPILVWALPEPELGGRLRLNSLTGANLACSVLARLQRTFKYVYADPEENEAGHQIRTWLRAAIAVQKLRKAVIAEIGNPPPGFYTSAVDPLELMRKIGPKLIHVDLGQVFREAANVPQEQYGPLLHADKLQVKGLADLPDAQVVKSLQFYVALKEICDASKLAAVAVRCWPECFTEYGGAACSALSHLIDDGIPAACEADVLGATSMLVQHFVTGAPTYLGDLVYADRQRNTATFWHCGVGAFALASEATGPVAGVHPTRKMGYALDNSLRRGDITIARLGQTPNGFQMLIIGGEALDHPKQFQGTSVVIQFKRPVREVLDAAMYGGFEHHYALVWEDITQDLVEICSLMQLPYTLVV